MDLDKAFVSALLEAGLPGLRDAQDRGWSASLLESEGLRAWEFAVEHLGKYGSLPDRASVEGRLGIVLDPPGPPLAFLADELVGRRMHSSLARAYEEGIRCLGQNEPAKALESTEKALYELRKEHGSASRIVSLPSLGDQALEFYRKIKAGERGILTPWGAVNEATLGFWPEDFVLIVARQATGKTWLALILAYFAWVSGYRVLLVSTEMSQLSIAIRWAALHLKLSYYEFRHGLLSSMDEDRMVKGIEAAKGLPGFDIIGGDFDFRIDSLDAAITESKPDFVVADGANLFKSDGASRTEKAANSFDEFKRVAKRRHVAVVLTSQFNREVKTGAKPGTMKAEKIALSDAAGWNADQIFALYQTDEMKDDKRMGLHPMKCREGVARDVEIRWDLDLMDFSELSGAGGGGSGPRSDADDSGADPGAAGGTDLPF